MARPGQSNSWQLRTYNPATGEWYLNFANPNADGLGIPDTGEFKDGRIDFYDQEQVGGKFILVRFSMWEVTPGMARSEQAFSGDGRKTWEVNWRTKYTRINGQPD